MIILDILTVLEPSQEWTFTGSEYNTKAKLKEHFSLAEADWSFTWSEFQSKKTEITNAIPLKLLRNERNRRLVACDWTQGDDVPSSIKGAWTTYRAALRDITDSATSLDDVTWPEKP
jgi:hypothetical protein|tara:strand:+ start:442 stop:792 length:351 start_codon:yes stop_codon:yes gene_type:complete